MAGNSFDNKAVPFGFDEDKWCVLEDEAIGLDYATVHIGGLYRQQLQAGGITAIAKNAWFDHVADHDDWALVGIPSESVSYDGESVISARVVVAPLTQTDAPPTAEAKAKNQFYAKLNVGSDDFVIDIDGMSGGPIFMLKHMNGAWRYGIIGVQSGWYPQSRVIAACSFKSFANELEPIVEEALRSAQNVTSPSSTV